MKINSNEALVINNIQYSTVKTKDDVQVDNQDFKTMLEEQIKEVFEKIKNGGVQQTYQIGARFFTVEEWSTFIDKFDSMEETIKELMEERQEKIEEKELEEEQLENKRILKNCGGIME